MPEFATTDLIAKFERDIQYGEGCINDKMRASIAVGALIDGSQSHLLEITKYLEDNAVGLNPDLNLAWRLLLEKISRSRDWDFKPPDWCIRLDCWLTWLKRETNYFPKDSTVTELIAKFEHEIRSIEEMKDMFVVNAIDASPVAMEIIKRGKHSLPAVIEHLESNKPSPATNRCFAWAILFGWLSVQYGNKRHPSPIYDDNLDTWIDWAKKEVEEYR